MQYLDDHLLVKEGKSSTIYGMQELRLALPPCRRVRFEHFRSSNLLVQCGRWYLPVHETADVAVRNDLP